MLRFLIMLSLFSGFSTTECVFDVRLSQILFNQGFHRNISYKVTFKDNNAPSYDYDDCYLGLDQTLPAGIYANPDELKDLRRMNKIMAIPQNRVNVELPAEQSQSTNVFVIGNVTKGEANLWLPVHARYHKAAKGGGLVPNNIPSPRLYLRCLHIQINRCKPTTSLITFLCDGRSKNTCVWKELPFDLLTDPVRLSVPVGDLDHIDIVAPVTLAVICICSMYLIKTLHDYKLACKKKS